MIFLKRSNLTKSGAFFMLGLAVCFSMNACKLDERALRQDIIEDMLPREKIYFTEYLNDAASNLDLDETARDVSRRSLPHILKYLKARGADFNRPDTKGWTALLYAAEQGDLESVRYLVEQVGCDIRTRNKQRVGPLMLAAQSGSLDLCQYLLSRGANVNARSTQGLSPLMYGASSGNEALVELLLKAGADPQLQDVSGHWAYEYTDRESLRTRLSDLVQAQNTD